MSNSLTASKGDNKGSKAAGVESCQLTTNVLASFSPTATRAESCSPGAERVASSLHDRAASYSPTAGWVESCLSSAKVVSSLFASDREASCSPTLLAPGRVASSEQPQVGLRVANLQIPQPGTKGANCPLTPPDYDLEEKTLVIDHDSIEM